MRARDDLIHSYAPLHAPGHRQRFEHLLTCAEADARAKALQEAKAEVVAWLVKKAHTDRTWDVGVLASKVDRGAIRLLGGPGEPGGREADAPDFFQPGHTYTDGTGYTAPEITNYFRVEHVTRHPDRGHLRAIGWTRTGEPDAGWHGDFLDEGEFDGWTDVTEERAR